VNFGVYYYDFANGPLSQGQMRIDGRQTCGTNRNQRCTEYFTNNNYYVYTPDTDTCCLSIPNLAPTPPQWLRPATLVGATNYVNLPVLKYNFYDDNNYLHFYFQGLNGYPVAFGDHNPLGTVIEFNLFQPGIIPSPTIFVLPFAKCHVECPSELRRDRKSVLPWINH